MVEEIENAFVEAGKVSVSNILELIGEDPSREGLKDTPSRVVKSWKEIYGGYSQDPEKILSTCFTEGACDEVVLLKDINFSSMCEHHMLPFLGTAHVAYLPSNRVVGISKLARLVDCFARRLQIQENMTKQIADTIDQVLKPRGVAVILQAHHQCMSCRGVNKQNTKMLTSAMRGVFRENNSARMEVLALMGF